MTGTVSRTQGLKPNGEMGAIGYVVAAGVALLLLPILPFVAVLWLFAKLAGTDADGPVRRRSGGET